MRKTIQDTAREVGKTFWEVSVQAVDSDQPDVFLPIPAKTPRGALKKALRVVQALEEYQDTPPC